MAECRLPPNLSALLLPIRCGLPSLSIACTPLKTPVPCPVHVAIAEDRRGFCSARMWLLVMTFWDSVLKVRRVLHVLQPALCTSRDTVLETPGAQTTAQRDVTNCACPACPAPVLIRSSNEKRPFFIGSSISGGVWRCRNEPQAVRLIMIILNFQIRLLTNGDGLKTPK